MAAATPDRLNCRCRCLQGLAADMVEAGLPKVVAQRSLQVRAAARARNPAFLARAAAWEERTAAVGGRGGGVEAERAAGGACTCRPAALYF